MPLNISDGSLSWAASIDTSNFDKKLDEMEASLQGTVKDLQNGMKGMGGSIEKAFDSAHDAIQDVSKAAGSLGAVATSVIPSWKELNSLFHGIFASRFGHGEGMKELSKVFSDMKEGKTTLQEVIDKLNLTEKETANVAAKMRQFATDGSAAFKLVGTEAGSASRAVGAIGDKITSLQSAVKSAGGGVKVFDPKALGVTAWADSIRRAASASTELKGATAGAFQSIKGGAQEANKEIAQTEGLANKAATAIGAFLSLAAAKGFVSDMIRVRSEFESLEISFGVLLKSKEKADQLMAQVVELAATTPFQLQDVAKGAKQLLALGVEASKVTDLLRRMGDIAAGGGVEMDRIIRAYGQVKALGRVRNEELLQLAEAGVPIYKELAKVLGVAEDKVGELVNTGVVGFDKLHKVIVNLTDEGGMFAGMMAAQSATLGGQISNLRDNWAKLLNDLGKSNEGILKGGVGIANTLIDNYQNVIDVVKVLIATYGTYRAALMLTTAASVATGVATKGLTVAQILQAGASKVAATAMAFLNRTLLANPFVAAATAVAALATALYLLSRRVQETSKSAQIMASAQKKISEGMSEAQAKIKPYVDALKDANVSEQKRAEIYNKLKEINPDIVKGLTAQTISYEKLKGNVDLYLESLRKKISLEANEGALTTSINEENTLQATLDRLRASYKRLSEQYDTAKKAENPNAQTLIELARSRKEVGAQIDETKALIEEQKVLQQNLGKAIVGPETPTSGPKTLKQYLEETDKLITQYDEYIKLIKNKDDADAVQKALTAKMESFAPGDKAKEAYKKKIQEVNELLKQYSIENPKTAANTQANLERKENALLEARKDLLQQIADIRAQADASTQGKQASEIEKINQKYTALIEKVDDFNTKVSLWNKDPKNKNNQVNGVDRATAVRQINEARALEISQEMMEQDVKNYEAALKEKSDLYKAYEQSIQEVGGANADKLYDKEKVAFASYLDYLKSEMGKFGTKISLGVDLNLADKEKMKLLTEELKKVTKEQADQQIADTKRVMVSTMNAAEQRKAIEARYLQDLEILRKTYTGKDLEERERVLKEALDGDLVALGQHLSEQSGLYRKLNKDIYDFVRGRIDNEIALREKQLKAIKNIDPGMAASIQRDIDKWVALRDQMDGTMNTMDKVERGAEALGPAFGDLASKVSPLNEELGTSLNLISDLLAGVKQAAASMKAFTAAKKAFDEAEKGKKMEGTLGMISAGLGVAGAAVGVISAVTSIFKARAEERKREREEQKQAQLDIYKGEQEINMLYRERAREQVLINKLKLEGLEAEKRLLEEQIKQNAVQLQSVFTELAKEFRKAANPAEAQILSAAQLSGNQAFLQQFSLAGKTYEELEKLSLQGLLTDRAQQLFEVLKKLKDEGVDINRSLEEAKRQAQEVFTGTSRDSIADSIIEGFKKGYRSAKDFADNFGELMQGALLNALKYQTLEAPLKAFYEQFAQDAQSGGALTQGEIATLQEQYNALITQAAQQFEDLQKVTGVSFKGGTGTQNSLAGAIKGITENQADLLSGTTNGIRLGVLELVKVGTQNLAVQNQIRNNTGISAQKLTELIDKLNRITSGAELLHTKVK
jgi:tape measure domain-containing protein